MPTQGAIGLEIILDLSLLAHHNDTRRQLRWGDSVCSRAAVGHKLTNGYSCSVGPKNTRSIDHDDIDMHAITNISRSTLAETASNYIVVINGVNCTTE